VKRWWKENWWCVVFWIGVVPLFTLPGVAAWFTSRPNPIPSIPVDQQQLGELVLIRKAVENMDRRDQERTEAAERLTKELLGELPKEKK